MTRPSLHPFAVVPLVLTAGALLVSCSGDPTQPTAEKRELDPIEVFVGDRCEEPPDPVIETIAQRLTVGARLEHPQVVASEDEEGLHFVAAEVVGEDLDDEASIGVWVVVGNLEPDPQVLSVNAVARYLSDWPDGTKSERRVTMAVDGGEASQECVEAAVE